MSPRPRKRPVPIRQAELVQQEEVLINFEETTELACDSVFEAADRFEDGDSFGGVVSTLGAVASVFALLAGGSAIAYQSHKRRRR